MSSENVLPSTSVPLHELIEAPILTSTEASIGEAGGGGKQSLMSLTKPTGYPTSAPSHAPTLRRAYLKGKGVFESDVASNGAGIVDRHVTLIPSSLKIYCESFADLTMSREAKLSSSTLTSTEASVGEAGGGGKQSLMSLFKPTGYPTSAPSHAPTLRRAYLKTRVLLQSSETSSSQVKFVPGACDFVVIMGVMLWPLALIFGFVCLMLVTAAKKKKVEEDTTLPEAMDAVTAVML